MKIRNGGNLLDVNVRSKISGGWAVIVIKKRLTELIKSGGDVFLGNNVILLGRNFD